MQPLLWELLEKRLGEWPGEGEWKLMLATGAERLYNLISVGWRGVCPSVISERNSVFETGRSVVTFPPTHTHSSLYSAVKHIRQEQEECRAVLVSSSTFNTCFMEHKRFTWVIRWLWRFVVLVCYKAKLLTVPCFCLSNHKMLIKTLF